MEESDSDYRWFVESIARASDANGDDEITEIIMESIGKAGIEGQDELAAVVVLIFQFFGFQVLLHNFRRVILNMPERGTEGGSESWQDTAGIASSFLATMIDELIELESLARQKETRWAAAMRIANGLLCEIAQNCLDLQGGIPKSREAIN